MAFGFFSGKEGARNTRPNERPDYRAVIAEQEKRRAAVTFEVQVTPETIRALDERLMQMGD